jgi:hypothetical protein
MNTYVDLVTTTGQIIRIECPTKHEDDLHETLDHARQRRLDRVNMAEIIGTL